MTCSESDVCGNQTSNGHTVTSQFGASKNTDELYKLRLLEQKYQYKHNPIQESLGISAPTWKGRHIMNAF